MFCDASLAERIERAEAQLVAKASDAARQRGVNAAGLVLDIAGGVASFAEDHSPFNKVAGLGFGGVPSTSALEEVEGAFAAVAAPVQIELAHLADPEINSSPERRPRPHIGVEVFKLHYSRPGWSTQQPPAVILPS